MGGKGGGCTGGWMGGPAGGGVEGLIGTEFPGAGGRGILIVSSAGRTTLRNGVVGESKEGFWSPTSAMALRLRHYREG